MCNLVPPPLLMLTQSRDGENQLAGSNLTFTIGISVDSYVDTPHTLFVSWTRNGSILNNGERIIVSNVSNTSGSNLYQAQLIFSSLSSTIDSGTYATSVSINSIPSFPYVTSALPTTEMVKITVTGKNSISAVVTIIIIIWYIFTCFA